MQPCAPRRADNSYMNLVIKELDKGNQNLTLIQRIFTLTLAGDWSGAKSPSCTALHCTVSTLPLYHLSDDPHGPHFARYEVLVVAHAPGALLLQCSLFTK